MSQSTNGHAPILDGDVLVRLVPRTDRGRRRVDDADWRRYEGYAAEILTAFGLDLSTPGTLDTPRRLATRSRSSRHGTAWAESATSR